MLLNINCMVADRYGVCIYIIRADLLPYHIIPFLVCFMPDMTFNEHLDGCLWESREHTPYRCTWYMLPVLQEYGLLIYFYYFFIYFFVVVIFMSFVVSVYFSFLVFVFEIHSFDYRLNPGVLYFHFW